MRDTFYKVKADMLETFAHIANDDNNEKQIEIILKNIYRLPAEMRKAGYNDDEIFYLTGIISAVK